MPLAERARDVEALNENGTNRYNNFENVIPTKQQGNSAHYRTAKLKRDHPKKAAIGSDPDCGNKIASLRHAESPGVNRTPGNPDQDFFRLA